MADGDFVTEAQIAALHAAIAAKLNTARAFRDLRDRMVIHSRATGAGQSTITGVGTGPSGTGTATACTQGWANNYSAFRRLDYLVTTAATTAVAGIRTNPVFARGSAGMPSSGWNGEIRGGPATGLAGAPSTNRFFMGLRGSSSAPTDVNPSTLTNIVGVGWDSGNTNWQLMYNDGSGSATKVDLGVAHPTADRVNAATSTGSLFEFSSSCVPGGTSIVWSFTDITTGTVIGSGTITSADIPATTVALSPYLYSSVGGTSSVVGCTFVDFTYETLT